MTDDERTLCLIQEKNDKAEFIAILKRLMINAKEGT